MLTTPKLISASRLLAAAALLAFAAGCNKDEEVVSPSVANEAITIMTLTLTNNATPSDVQTATWEQLLDGQGNPVASGSDVSKANLTLKANTTYTCTVGLLDKTQTPTFDVGAEIKERANIHSFFFQPLPTTAALVIPAPTGAGQQADIAKTAPFLALEERHDALIQQHQAVISRHDAVLKRHAELEASHASSQVSDTQMAQDHAQMKTEAQQIQQEHRQLVEDHANLMAEHKNLLTAQQ